MSSRCDGHNDCMFQVDEESCPFRLPACDNGTGDGCQCDHATQFTCHSRRECVPLHDQCDGVPHCTDGSDELNCICSTLRPKPREECPAECDNATEFTCVIDNTCIDLRYRCDGVKHCIDFSDETDCPLQRCSASQFTCANQRQCIRVRERCDYAVNCVDGSDEHDCRSYVEGARLPLISTKICDDPSEMSCFVHVKGRHPVEQCIKQENICDGRVHCLGDPFDEMGCQEFCDKNDRFKCRKSTRCFRLGSQLIFFPFLVKCTLFEVPKLSSN